MESLNIGQGDRATDVIHNMTLMSDCHQLLHCDMYYERNVVILWWVQWTDYDCNHHALMDWKWSLICRGNKWMTNEQIARLDDDKSSDWLNLCTRAEGSWAKSSMEESSSDLIFSLTCVFNEIFTQDSSPMAIYRGVWMKRQARQDRVTFGKIVNTVLERKLCALERACLRCKTMRAGMHSNMVRNSKKPYWNGEGTKCRESVVTLLRLNDEHQDSGHSVSFNEWRGRLSKLLIIKVC